MTMQTAETLFEYLQTTFEDVGLTFHPAEAGQPWIAVPAQTINEVCKFLRDDADMMFDTLMCLSGVHFPKEELFGVTYHLHSTRHRNTLVLKVMVPVDNPLVASVESVWKTADWHEREAWDMFGIRFDGHPDCRRILCPEDWEGHPLRKDYRQQETYGGLETGL